MKSLILLAMITQFQLPPTPPASATGGPALEDELSRTADRYRRQCYSEKAIKIIVDDTRRARAAVRLDVASVREANKELADAINAQPFDENRVVLATRARARVQANSQAHSIVDDSESNIAILEQLPKADQVLFARSNFGRSPVYRLGPCA